MSDYWPLAVMAAFFAFCVGIGVGLNAAGETTAKDCDKLGGFTYAEQVYECRRKP